LKEKGKGSSVLSRLRKERHAILEKIKKHKSRVEKIMQGAPFWRLADKIGFVFGTLVIIAFNYMIGKYPHDLFYPFYVSLTIGMLIVRYAHYYSLGWHYYISDFCYFANVLIVILITFAPKNDRLIKICFLFSEGAIAVSIKVFRNSLVFHKIDTLTSLFIHLFPMIVMYHIRWFTIPD
jgi:hypothetical protein